MGVLSEDGSCGLTTGPVTHLTKAVFPGFMARDQAVWDGNVREGMGGPLPKLN